MTSAPDPQPGAVQPCMTCGIRGGHWRDCSTWLAAALTEGAVTADLRTQLAEVLAGHATTVDLVDTDPADPFAGRFRYGCTCGHVRGTWTEREAIDRMPDLAAEQRVHVADALLALDLLAAARAEGAAEATKPLLHALNVVSQWSASTAQRHGGIGVREYAQQQGDIARFALSPTVTPTTEEDPK